MQFKIAQQDEQEAKLSLG